LYLKYEMLTIDKPAATKSRIMLFFKNK